MMAPEIGLMIPSEQQSADYKAILSEGVGRLKALGFSPTSRLEVGDHPGQKIAEIAYRIGIGIFAVLCRVGRPYLPNQPRDSRSLFLSQDQMVGE